MKSQWKWISVIVLSIYICIWVYLARSVMEKCPTPEPNLFAAMQSSKQSKIREESEKTFKIKTQRQLYKMRIQSFVEQRHCGSRLQTRFLVVKPRSGLGNRMLEIISAFVLAMVTDRFFLMHWEVQPGIAPCVFEDLFQPLPWTFRANEWLYHWEYEGSGAKKYQNQTRIWSPLYGELDEASVRAARDLSSMSLGKADSDDKVWTVVSNQYFLPLLLKNPVFTKRLQKMLGVSSISLDLLGQMVARALFAPSVHVGMVLSKTHGLLKPSFGGVHVRKKMMEHRDLEPVMDDFVQCVKSTSGTKEKKNNSYDSNDLKFLTSKNWYVASDDSGYKAQLVKEMQQLGIKSTFLTDSVDRRDRQNMVVACAELFQLALADTLVTTSLSTFGYMAALLGGVRPFVVSVDGGLCQQSSSISPCFQATANGVTVDFPCADVFHWST